jgi:hypothetical protein
VEDLGGVTALISVGDSDPVAGSCEHEDKFWRVLKGREILDQLNYY